MEGNEHRMAEEMRMSFGKRVQEKRETQGLSQAALAALLGVSQSTVGNYEADISFPKEEVLLRLFDCLGTDPNTLFQDSFRGRGRGAEPGGAAALGALPGPASAGRETLRSVSEALCAFRDEMARAPGGGAPGHPPLPLPGGGGLRRPGLRGGFRLPHRPGGRAAGGGVRRAHPGDSMEPFLRDGGVAYVNHDPLRSGDAGIFCVDGEMFCKQYYRDPLGMVYLFSLNRKRADADILLPPESGRSLVCLGRVMLHTMPCRGRTRRKGMDIALAYQEKGSGEPLILLHGNGEDSSYFRHQIAHFQDRYRVIALDTRGHGKSPRGSAPFTIRQFARDLLDFLEIYGIADAVLLGFSDGRTSRCGSPWSIRSG